MSDRVISEYRTGCETDTSYWSNPTGVFWILITYICDVLLRRISRDFNKFDAIALAYFVDGVFLNNSGKYSEDYLKQEFDTFFYQNLRVVYWEIIEKFGLNEAFLGNNPALFSWKFEQAELKKSKFPMANKLLIHHNGHLKPFFFATRQNKRYF